MCGGVQTSNDVPDSLIHEYLSAELNMSLGTVLLVIVVLALLGALPTWRHSRDWGYAPSGIIGVVLVVVAVMFLAGRI
jgi:hypothetical protein